MLNVTFGKTMRGGGLNVIPVSRIFRSPKLEGRDALLVPCFEI